MNKITNYFKITIFLILIIFLSSCSTTKEISKDKEYSTKILESGVASWYGPNFHGKQTANGETYDMNSLTAAHRTLPFNTIVKVFNRDNNKSVNVRINDRGPFAKNRIIDLSKQAAKILGLINNGTANVFLSIVKLSSKLPEDIKKAHFTVQVGSFLALSDAKKYSNSFNNSFVQKALVKGNNYYRVYVGRYSNKNNASTKQKQLKRKGFDCFVKQIEN